MDHGEFVQVGTPSEIYEYPSSRFVADFIGAINMFEGRLIEDEPSYVRIESDDLENPIYVDHGVSSAPGATVWAAIRPEKIHVSARRARRGRQLGARRGARHRLHGRHVHLPAASSTRRKVVRVTQPNVHATRDDASPGTSAST